MSFSGYFIYSLSLPIIPGSTSVVDSIILITCLFLPREYDASDSNQSCERSPEKLTSVMLVVN